MCFVFREDAEADLAGHVGTPRHPGRAGRGTEADVVLSYARGASEALEDLGSGGSEEATKNTRCVTTLLPFVACDILLPFLRAYESTS